MAASTPPPKIVGDEKGDYEPVDFPTEKTSSVIRK